MSLAMGQHAVRLFVSFTFQSNAVLSPGGDPDLRRWGRQEAHSNATLSSSDSVSSKMGGNAGAIFFGSHSVSSVRFSSVQSLDRLGCRGDMKGDSAEILLQFFLQEAPVSSSGMGRDVYRLMLSIQRPSQP